MNVHLYFIQKILRKTLFCYFLTFMIASWNRFLQHTNATKGMSLNAGILSASCNWSYRAGYVIYNTQNVYFKKNIKND